MNLMMQKLLPVRFFYCFVFSELFKGNKVNML